MAAEENIARKEEVEMQSETESEVSISSSKKDKTASFEKPSSTRMCLFQLTESNELSRVATVLEELSTKPKETIKHLSKKYKLHTTVSQTVLKKYCNGDYGFDKVIARDGQFQLALLKLISILASDYLVYMQFM